MRFGGRRRVPDLDDQQNATRGRGDALDFADRRRDVVDVIQAVEGRDAVEMPVRIRERIALGVEVILGVHAENLTEILRAALTEARDQAIEVTSAEASRSTLVRRSTGSSMTRK